MKQHAPTSRRARCGTLFGRVRLPGLAGAAGLRQGDARGLSPQR